MIKLGKWQHIDKTGDNNWMLGIDPNLWILGIDPNLFDFDFSEGKISPVTFEFLRQNLGFRVRQIQNYASSKEPLAPLRRYLAVEQELNRKLNEELSNLLKG